jgi:hypothetical protein
VWVQTDPVESKKRATKKQPDNSQLDSAQFDAAMRQFQNPTQAEKPVVISGKHTFTTQLRTVLKRLAGVTPTSPPKREPPRTAVNRNIIVR